MSKTRIDTRGLSTWLICECGEYNPISRDDLLIFFKPIIIECSCGLRHEIFLIHNVNLCKELYIRKPLCKESAETLHIEDVE